jgi:hypothetical protein
MKQRSGNRILGAVLSVLLLFSIYIAGTLVLEMRQEVRDGDRTSEMGNFRY